MIDIEITAGTDSDDRTQTVTLSVDYYLSLVAAKRELKQLKAALPTCCVPDEPCKYECGYYPDRYPEWEPYRPDAAGYLLEHHPELVDYAGMTLSQAADMYPDLIDYDLYERDC